MNGNYYYILFGQDMIYDMTIYDVNSNGGKQGLLSN